MKPLLAVLALLALCATGQAQTIEYTIPTEYDLVPGRLSVTFADTVSEATARALIGALGYAVAEDSHFAPVSALATLEHALTDAQYAMLAAHPGVLALHPYDAAHPPPEALSLAPAADTEPGYALIVRFEPHLTQEAAAAILDPIPAIRLVKIDKRPNELIVALPEEQEDEAVERLGALPQVRYVAFVASND